MSYLSVQEERRRYRPSYPQILDNVANVDCIEEGALDIDPALGEIFPSFREDRVVRCVVGGGKRPDVPLRVGVVFSGGPAPGGHNVVAGLYDAMMECHAESVLIGFQNGLGGLIQNKNRELGKQEIDLVRNSGGFDLLGTGRKSIQGPEDLEMALHTLQENRLNCLVVIGGDDSNTDAAYLAHSCAERQIHTSIIGVPKTIDGDLQSADIPISFGFDTACSVYSEIIGNIAKDILSMKKYYFFVRLMGRSASHVTLECASRIHPNLALISEEIDAKRRTIKDVVGQICDLVEERYKEGKKYGLIFVPEGIIEHFSDVQSLIVRMNNLLAVLDASHKRLGQSLAMADRIRIMSESLDGESRACFDSFPNYMQAELVSERDPHGNVQVSKIETERLLMHLVGKELEARGAGIPFVAQSEFCGYEGRSAFPSNFDCNYCTALGRLALVLALRKKSGYMTAIRKLHKDAQEWEVVGVPLVSLMHFEQRLGKRKAVVRKTKVDLEGKRFVSFSQQRAAWRLADDYHQPGPMRFSCQLPHILQ